MYDGVIIGGGVIGLFSARALHERGLKVALIDDGRAGQASSAAGGILSPLYPWRTSAAVSNLLRASLRLYQSVLADMKASHARACSRPGLLYLNCPDEDAASLWAKRHGWSLRTHSAADVRKLEPGLATSIIQDGGFSLPAVQRLSPSALLAALRARLDKKVDFYRQAAMNIVVKNRRVRAVQLSGQALKTPCVAVCAGAWMAQLLPTLSAIQPVRGQMIRFAATNHAPKHIVLRRGHYLIPSPDGGLVVGSTVEEVGFDLRTTARGKRELSAVAHALVPKLKGAPIVEHWAGLRPGFVRQEPLIARHPDLDGLFAHGGHFRNGISLAPASAERLARIMCEESDHGDSAYRWPRPATNNKHYNESDDDK